MRHYTDGTKIIGLMPFQTPPEGFTEIAMEEVKAIQAAKITPAQQYEQDLADWKAERQAKVEAIEVSYIVSSGEVVVFQGDEESQGRITRPIAALPDDTTTVPWVAKDNSVWPLTKSDLRAILLDAGTQQSAIWNEGRPVKPEGVE